MFSFSKFTVSAATALSLTLTPMPAAAGPDGEDIAKVLAGIALLGIIAKAADNDNDRDRQQSVIDDRSRYGRLDSFDDRRSTRTIDGELRRYGQSTAKKAQGYKKKNPLPKRCLLVLDTDRGRDRLVYGQKCLKRSFKFAKKLPEQCRMVVRTDRGRRAVYGARCLSRDGWRVARR